LLNFGDCKNIPDGAFAHLANLPKLQTLWLENTSTSDSTMPYIARIKSLKELELVNTNVTIAGIKQLSRLPNLEHLKFRGQPIDPGWVPVLAKFPKLIKLGFASTNIDDATLAAIARQMPRVENIDLENCKGVTDAGLASIRKMKKLFWTKVTGTSVTPAAVEAYKKHPPTPTSTIN
jgi:internalin A